MELELKAQTRKETGRKLKTLRQKGFIPAVVYGPGHKPISIQVDYEEFRKVFEEAGESTIIKLKIHPVIRQGAPSDDGAKSKVEAKNVLIHEIASDPVTDRFIHADFYQIRMDKAITTEVPFVFEGEAPAVKSLDGVLIKNIIEVEIEALPKDLPHEIKIDISSLDNFDKHIRIKDLILPPGVKILAESEEVVVSVMPPRTEEELKALEEKPEEKVEEVEIAKEKEIEGEEKEAPETLEKKEEPKEGSSK